MSYFATLIALKGSLGTKQQFEIESRTQTIKGIEFPEILR